MKQRITERSLRISAIYAVVTAIWIILSDRLIALFTKDFEYQTFLQTIKGLVFITLTASLIYTLLRQELERQQRTLNKLHESEERYRYLVKVSPVAILVNRGNRIEFINPAGLTLFGASTPEQMIGKTPYEVFHPDFHDTVRQRIFRLTEARETVPLIEEQIVRLDGTVRDVAVMATSFTDHVGNAIQVMLHDITERKKAEQELARYREQLEEMVEQRTAQLRAAYAELQVLSQAKDEFVSNVSHELKTPITTLKLRHHLLRRRPDLLEEHLGVLERETVRLDRTIDDLLRLSRLDQDRVEVVFQPVDMNVLVQFLVNDRALQAEQKQLRLTFVQSDRLPSVAADPGLLEQIVSILLTNAINYTLSGGQITVRTQLQAHNAVWVGVSVTDTGLGILPHELPHLFERFFQGQANRQAGVPGTGLGLAIAKAIVDRHQGRIEVASTGIPGEGTTFTVWLPAFPE